MEFSELIDLFKKVRKNQNWGELSYILFYDDGSGEVVSEDNVYDGDAVFEFDTEKQLIAKLKEYDGG